MKRLFLLCVALVPSTLPAAEKTADRVGQLAAGHAYNSNPKGMDRMQWERLLPRLEAQAEQGDYRALHRLASLHQEGRGVVRDEDRAQEYFSQAHELRARHLAGQKAFASGAGSMDRLTWKNALAKLEGQAATGDHRALYRLGRFYQKGQGVAQDEARALEYIQRAADDGYGRAQYRMGQFAERGYGGLATDQDAAREWYKMSYDAGTSKALQSLERLLEADAERARNSKEPWNERVHALGQIAKYTDTNSDGGRAYVRSTLPEDMGLVLNDRGALNFTDGEIARLRDDEERRAQVAALFDEMNRGMDDDPLTFDRYYKHELRKHDDAQSFEAEMKEEADLIAAIKLLKMARVKGIDDKVRTALWEQAEVKLAAGNKILLQKYGTAFDADAHDIVMLPALREKPINAEQAEVQAKALFTDDRMETVLFLCRQYIKTRVRVGIEGPGYLMPEKTYDDEMVIGIGSLHAVLNALRARLSAGTASDAEWSAAVQFLTALCDEKKLQGKKLIAGKFVSRKENVLTAAAEGLGMSPGHRVMVRQFLTAVPKGLAAIPLTFSKDEQRFVFPHDDKALSLGEDTVLPLKDLQRLAPVLNPLLTIPGLRDLLAVWDAACGDKGKDATSDIMATVKQWKAAVRTIVAAANDGRIRSSETSKYLALVAPVLPVVVGRGWVEGEGLVPVTALLEDVPKSKNGALAAHMKKIRAQYDAFSGKETEEDETVGPPPSPAASVRTIDDASSVDMSDGEEDVSVDEGKVVDGRLMLSPDALKLAKSILEKAPLPEKKKDTTPKGPEGSLLRSAASHANEWRDKLSQFAPDDDADDEGWSDDEGDDASSTHSRVVLQDKKTPVSKSRDSERTAKPAKPSALPVARTPLAKPVDFMEAMRRRRAAIAGEEHDDGEDDPLDPTASSEKEKRAERQRLAAERQRLRAHDLQKEAAKAADKTLEKRFDNGKDESNFTGSNPLYRQQKTKKVEPQAQKKKGISLTDEQQHERDQEERARRMALAKTVKAREVRAPAKRGSAVLDLSGDD